MWAGFTAHIHTPCLRFYHQAADGTLLAFFMAGLVTFAFLLYGNAGLRIRARHLRVVPHLLDRILKIGFWSFLEGLMLFVGQSAVVMLVMNDRGMQALLSSRFKLGGDASAAAGPVGRHAEASTDWKLKAEILTYSRARGLFAGLTLNGSAIHQDTDATRELYGRMVPFRSS